MARFSDFEKANPFLAPAREKMHEELRKMYLKEEMSKPIHYPTFQEALDAALAMGEGTYLNVENCTASAVVRLPKEKVLVPQSVPQAPPGANLLSPGKVRVGDEVKNGYLDRLREAYADGLVSQGEFDARSNAVLAALTREEADLVFRDLPAQKKEVIQAPPPPEPPTVFCWVLNLFMILFPVLAGMGMLFGGSPSASAALAIAGGAAALILTCMGRTGMK